MSEAFLKIVNMSISAGWLVLAVLALRLLLKKAPKWVNVLLWGIVAIRLICPFSIESALSLIPSAETISPNIMMDRTPEISTGIQSLDRVVNPVISTSFAPEPIASANPLQILIPVAANLWLLGVMIMLAYTGISYLILRGKLRMAVILRDNIFQCETVRSPFVLGILRPRIYLPYTMEERDLCHVVAHEQAHIRRKDHWWKPLGFLLLTVHWFNPLMWAAYILLCRDIELACDEKVIAELNNEQRADYTQALVACSVGRRMIAACPLAFGEVGVKKRVKNVLDYRKPGFWIIMIAVVICIILAVCFLTDPDTPDMNVLPLIHSHGYSVTEYAYEYTLRSFHYVPGVNTPVYAITEDMELLEKEDPVIWDWTSLGILEKTELTRRDFENMFGGDGSWFIDETVASFRQTNANVWTLVFGEDKRYYVFQQKNGDLFLGFGYFDADNSTHEFDCFKLAVDVTLEQGVVAVSGEYTVPLTVFPAGTAVGNFENAVQWLTIAPHRDGELPFTLLRDGEEMEAHYLIYDPETYEPLPYMVYEDIPSQTHIFDNADISKRYIIVAVCTTEDDADRYCFGVQFQNSDQLSPKETVIAWIDDAQTDIHQLDEQKITLPAFSGVTFCYSPDAISVEANDEKTPLIASMHIRNAFFADLTGDGFPEICATVSFGSGITDTHVVVYDYANGQEYTLWDRCIYDYYLRAEDGALLCCQYAYPMEEADPLATGELILTEAGGGGGKRLTMDIRSTKPGSGSIADIVDRTVTEQLPTDEAIEVFYEDGQYVYSFASIRSHLVMVTHQDGSTEDIKTALEAGRAAIIDLDRFGIHYYMEPNTNPIEPTQTNLRGFVADYLFVPINGATYRYTLTDLNPENVTADQHLDTFTEETHIEGIVWEVYSLKEYPDMTRLLLRSGANSVWLFEYAPAQQAEADALEAARAAGFVVVEDGRLTDGKEAWAEFYGKTQRGEHASIRVAHYYTLDAGRTDPGTYEAYRQDYPALYIHELDYDGGQFVLRTEYEVKVYEYLMKYTVSGTPSVTSSEHAVIDRYVLTHDNTHTLEQLWNSLLSSATGAAIDHYTICSEYH